MKLTHVEASRKLIRKFWGLYILNCTDILITYTFLKTGGFYEANPFMRSIVTNPYLCLLIKVILPGIAILFLVHYLEHNTKPLAHICQWAANFIILVYFLINTLHIYYFFTIIS